MISIVLVEPENPDNIGASARALKNMGLENLRLVKPPSRWKKRGRKMAMSALDVLENAQVFKSVRDSVADAHLVIGTTRRVGPKRGAFISFPEALRKIKSLSRKGRVAILFGKESKGLDNNSLALCDWLTTIPSSAAYPSLNLAQAVMATVLSLYEAKVRKTLQKKKIKLLPKKEIEEVMERFEKALRVLEYEVEENGIIERIMKTFHRLLKRNGLLQSEAQMLRGLSRRICDKVNERPMLRDATRSAN